VINLERLYLNFNQNSKDAFSEKNINRAPALVSGFFTESPEAVFYFFFRRRPQGIQEVDLRFFFLKIGTHYI
jgi:hypothetical protein